MASWQTRRFVHISKRNYPLYWVVWFNYLVRKMYFFLGYYISFRLLFKFIVSSLGYNPRHLNKPFKFMKILHSLFYEHTNNFFVIFTCKWSRTYLDWIEILSFIKKHISFVSLYLTFKSDTSFYSPLIKGSNFRNLKYTRGESNKMTMMLMEQSISCIFYINQLIANAQKNSKRAYVQLKLEGKNIWSAVK